MDWLNHVYAGLDSYANFFLPMRDQARTPLQRLFNAGVIDPETEKLLQNHIQTIIPRAPPGNHHLSAQAP